MNDKIIAALSLCDKIANAIAGGELDLALAKLSPLRTLEIEIDSLAPADARLHGAFVDMLGAALADRKLHVAGLALEAIQMTLAEAATELHQQARPASPPN